MTFPAQCNTTDTFMDAIIVNATALKSGGGLTILRQFIGALPEDGNEYVAFIHRSVTVSDAGKNLRIIRTDVTAPHKRIWWDVAGLKRWLKKNSIRPVAAISLQNTGFRVPGKCPGYIYYHQPLPLYINRWSLLKKTERTTWFYKNIYPLYIRLFLNSRTEILVQLTFLKEAFSARFRFPEEKIHVVFPEVNIPAVKNVYNCPVDNNCLNLFYPVSGEVYKNHDILFRALASIDDRPERKTALYLTIDEKGLKKPDLKNVTFVFLGPLSHDNVLWLYSKVDALVFPSYIETLGLPLIEAAAAGLPILVSDLPYAHEVLTDYSGAEYIDYKDHTKWAEAILRLQVTKGTKFVAYKSVRRDSWEEFFSVIESRLQKPGRNGVIS